MSNEIISQYKIDNTLWEIEKSTYENERKCRTEIKFHIKKDGKDFYDPPYTFYYDQSSAMERILAEYYVKKLEE